MGSAVVDSHGRKRYFGLYRAEVAEIDTGLKMCRVKLLIPEVLGATVSNWAYLANPVFGGKSAPEINLGDRVLASFIGGDPERPIWAAQWFASPDGQPEIPLNAQGLPDGPTKYPRGYSSSTITDIDDAEIEVRAPTPAMVTEFPSATVIRGSSGVQIEMDNTEDNPRCQIWHPTGAYYEIRPDGGMASESVGNRFAGTSGNKTDVVKGSSMESAGGLIWLNGGKGIDLQAAQGPIRLVSAEGDILVKSNYDTNIEAGQLVTDCAKVSVSSRGAIELLSGDAIIASTQRIEEQVMSSKQTVIGNAFANVEAKITTIISGDDRTSFIGPGSKKVMLAVGQYVVDVISGSYTVTVLAGTASFTIGGNFSVTAVNYTLTAAAISLLASSSITAEAPSIVMSSSGPLILSGISITEISASPIFFLTPLVTIGGGLGVGGQLAVTGLSNLAGLTTVGTGTSTAVKGEDLIDYLNNLVTVFNNHTHSSPGSPPSASAPTPPTSLLADKLKLE